MVRERKFTLANTTYTIKQKKNIITINIDYYDYHTIARYQCNDEGEAFRFFACFPLENPTIANPVLLAPPEDVLG
jgi:hypothetical protein